MLLYSAFDLPQPLEGSAGAWFGTIYTNRAVVVATAGLLAFGLTAGLVSRTSTATHRRDGPDPRTEPFAIGGIALLAFAVAGWMSIALVSLGPTFFLASYHQWLAATLNRPVSYTYYGIGLGLVLTVATASPAWRRRGLLLFAIFAAAALPIGLRGEVLFPAAAAAAIYARSSRPPGRLVVVVMIIGVLTGISAIQQVRQVGFGGLAASEISATPLQAVAELGASLRTVDVVVQWHAIGGDASLQNGATYIAPFERPIRGRILGLPTPPANADMRLMNVEMRTRETTIGGSFIAEGYRNFGLLGAALVPALFGLLLGWFDRRRSTIIAGALMGVVLVSLLQHIRNSFAPVPFQILTGFAIVWLLTSLSNAIVRRSAQRVHRSRTRFST